MDEGQGTGGFALGKQINDIAVGVLVFLCIGLFLLGFSQGFGYWQVAVLLALALFIAGSLFGFLFGIPKVTTAVAATDSQLTSVRRMLDVNTNLEQISDWLTKIIVGVGLIELRQVPSLVRRFNDFAKPAFHTQWSSQALATATTIYFPVLGFLSGYLITRLYLSSLIGRADVELRRVAAAEAATAARFIDAASSRREKTSRTAGDTKHASAPKERTIMSALLASHQASAAQALTAFIQTYSPAYRQRLRSSIVLWVFNNPTAVEDERHALRALGVREKIASTAEEAIDIVKRGGINAIACDMKLDGKSSKEFIQCVRDLGFRGYIAGYPSPGTDISESNDLLSGTRLLANMITTAPDQLFTSLVEALLPTLNLN